MEKMLPRARQIAEAVAMPRDSLATRMQARGTLPSPGTSGSLLRNVFSCLVPTGPNVQSASNSTMVVPSASSTATARGIPARTVPARPVAAQEMPVTLMQKAPVQTTLTGRPSRLRASLVARLKDQSSKPRRRKRGKQRPSIVFPVVPVASLSSKPRRRKRGKQRPSIAPSAIPGTTRTAHQQAVLHHLVQSAKAEAKLQDEKKAAAQAAQQKTEQARTAGRLASATRRSEGTQPGHSFGPCEAVRKKTPLPDKKAEDNYELSDLEEDADGNRIEPDRKGKRVPAWSVNFVEIVKSQADIDPDSIFGSGVPYCNLDIIFPDKLYLSQMTRRPVKRKRGSSCHWSQDRLTRKEVTAYAHKMGQVRRWTKTLRSQPTV